VLRVEVRVIVALWCCVSAITLAVAVPSMDAPGLYYDEAFLAQQGRDFAEPARLGSHPPSTRQTKIFGRSYPLRNAAYLGSLKSQLAIPALAAFGSSPRVLRTATLVVGLLGLLFSLLWAERCFGLPTALFGGALLASDPSFYFFSQYEWGPFTTGLLCRSAGFLLLVVGWHKRSLGWMAAAGLVLGLGVYSRVDFVVILAAAGLGLLVAQPRVIADLLGDRLRLALAAVAGFCVTSATTLVAIRQILSSSAGIADRGDLAYRSDVLWSVLDGAHFLELMRVGGRFDVMFEGDASGGLFGHALIVACAVLAIAAGVSLVQSAASPEGPTTTSRGRSFLLVSTAVTAIGMLSISGAVRAHHALNIMPFAHFAVAAALAIPWGTARGNARPRSAAFARGGTLGLAAIIIALNFATIVETNRFVRDTGGLGRWSNSLQAFGEEADRSRETTVVSLDWGFHEPLQFTSQRAVYYEPIWQIADQLRQGRIWTHVGDEHHVYLVHLAPYDLFGFSEGFREASRAVPKERVEEKIYRDGNGDPIFASLRFDRPHVIVYSGKFEIRFQ
jgi:hypothetical protein